MIGFVMQFTSQEQSFFTSNSRREVNPTKAYAVEPDLQVQEAIQ